MTKPETSAAFALLRAAIDGSPTVLSVEAASTLHAEVWDARSEAGNERAKMRRARDEWTVREAALVEQAVREERRAVDAEKRGDNAEERAERAEAALALCLGHLRTIISSPTGNTRNAAFREARRWLRIYDGGTDDER